MYNSFLVKIRASNDIVVRDIAKEIYSSIEELGENIGYFTVSSFLGYRKYNVSIEKGKIYLFKITTVDSDTFAIITSNLFKKRISKEYLYIYDNEFEVKEIVLNDDNSKYIKVFSDRDLDYINSDECEIDSYNISILTPTIFKVGSKFYNHIDSEVLFRNLFSKFNKYSKYKISKEFIENIHDINIIVNDISYSKLRLNNMHNEGFQGSITIDLKDCNKDTKRIARTLIEFSQFSGIGYNCEYGYGCMYIR